MLEKGFTVPELLQPALPPSASWLPLPAGWTVLGELLLASLAIYLIFRFARWRRNRWRREALSALAVSHTIDGWMALIKQILLVHHSRETIGRSLKAEAILRHVPLTSTLAQTLCARYCQRDNLLDAGQEAELRQQLMHWLKELPDV
ncbi:TPA: DUF4381 family protein [Raoultella ornithinolytica]|nr:DUF4381 family protein [Raoultella ornithinolytica]HAT1614289.1 DUF4381 family protein [Raoultella ornithinolytica]